MLLMPTADAMNDQARVQNAGSAMLGPKQRMLQTFLGKIDYSGLAASSHKEVIRGIGSPRENRGTLRGAANLDLAYPDLNPYDPKRFVRTLTIPRIPPPRHIKPVKERKELTKEQVAACWNLSREEVLRKLFPDQ